MKFKLLLLSVLVLTMLLSACAQSAVPPSGGPPQSSSEQEAPSSSSVHSPEEEQVEPEEENFEHAPEKFGYVLYEYPKPDILAKDIKEIVISFTANFLLTHTGEVYAWGLNELGALGLGLPLDAMVLTPAKIEIGEPVEKLVEGKDGGSMIAVGESGTIYGWGWNTLSQFPGVEEIYIPKPIKFDFAIDINHVAVSGGRLTLCDNSGNIYTTGYKLGEHMSFIDYVSEYGKLPEINELKGPVGRIKNISSISNSDSCSAFLTEDGKVFILGVVAEANGFDYYDKPTEIHFKEKIVKLKAITCGLVALSESGRLYFMGEDRFGIEDERVEASDETYYDLGINIREKPMAVKKFDKKVKDFAVSFGSIVVHTEDDEFYTWGYNLGRVDAETDDQTIFKPTQIDLPQNTEYLSMGGCSGVAIDDNNKVYAWGSGYYGIYMGDTYHQSHTPRELLFGKE